MKTTVVYHSADFDGLFCREIAKKFLPDAELIGWNFGDAPLQIPSGPLYVMDLPLDRPFGFDYSKVGNERGPQHPAGLVWIDHHKSSIDSHPKDIPGYRIDGVAACRLAWQWFSMVDGNTREGYVGHGCPAIRPAGVLPMIHDYKRREVNEPLAVRLAGEYDIWDHRGDGDLEFQYGLKTEEPDINWKRLLNGDENYTASIVSSGRSSMRYAKNMDAFWLAEAGHVIEWEGLKFLAKNSVERGSGILDSKDVPETGHDALMLYGYRGKYWTVSMYHAKHRKDIDLSIIASKNGGGGHRGACGFTCKRLPFMS